MLDVYSRLRYSLILWVPDKDTSKKIGSQDDLDQSGKATDREGLLLNVWSHAPEEGVGVREGHWYRQDFQGTQNSLLRSFGAKQ